MPEKNRLRACITCRKTFTATRPDQTRCPVHQVIWDRVKDATDRQARPYDHGERLEHAAIITAWVEANGWRCPGTPEGHPPHPVGPGSLTVHHLAAVGDGGSRVGGQKAVLCLTENQRLGGSLGGQRSRP